MRLSLRVVLIALVALVAAGAIYNVLPGASSDTTDSNFTPGWCLDDGVSLHIETTTSQQTRCALAFTGTGWDLFTATETKVQGTAQYPTGFVCRINDYPDSQDCLDMPRFDEGSWAYFFAEPGDTEWRFSPVGSATRKPTCGGAEAWVFVDASSKSTKPATKPTTLTCR